MARDSHFASDIPDIFYPMIVCCVDVVVSVVVIKGAIERLFCFLICNVYVCIVVAM